MSTSYQLTFSKMEQDIEFENRFYKKRDILSAPQSPWLFNIFRISMSTRIIAQGIVSTIFAIMQMSLYYMIVDKLASNDSDNEERLEKM